MSVEDKYENLKIYVVGLETTLAQRNARIKQLEEQVKKEDKSLRTEAAKRKAYKQGWKDCASYLMETTREAALALSDIRKDAFKMYLDGDKL